MTIFNPYMLPKVRSVRLMSSIKGMPCSLRIASFIGLPCAPIDTVVGCHVGNIGKGVSTKVSDMHVAAGCCLCHDLIDGRDSRIEFIRDKYGAALWERIALGMMETQARQLMEGNIVIPDGELI